MKFALVIAMVSAATLNITCGMLGRVFEVHQHCVTVAIAPNARFSEKLICETPMSMNRKFSDIVPVRPGSRTFSVEATRANSRYTVKRAGSADSQCDKPSASMLTPGIIASAIKNFAFAGISSIPPSLTGKKAEAPQAIAAWVTSDTVAWMESRTAPGEGPLPGAASDLARAVRAAQRTPAKSKQHG